MYMWYIHVTFNVSIQAGLVEDIAAVVKEYKMSRGLLVS